MKNTIKVFTSLSLILLLTSCGINKAWVLNQNQSATQVHLAESNFKVIGQVKGSADVGYVLAFGGAKKKQLYDAAYSNMLEKADLTDGSKALINVFTEEHLGGVPPFYFKRTLTVTATVIEFTD
ncbi:MAG: hypothetical protein GYB31_06590 [Bacteroidetes bacterium]|nr:hypothetical protein [Bacteroidota bacterium]